ncbi:MAG: hypothetical protein LBT22_09095 [Peptococcaceae bacterium]|jgi:hypothetical protein|nr:hypothetical protein [Peptococcaceae bacterium]
MEPEPEDIPYLYHYTGTVTKGEENFFVAIETGNFQCVALSSRKLLSLPQSMLGLFCNLRITDFDLDGSFFMDLGNLFYNEPFAQKT